MGRLPRRRRRLPDARRAAPAPEQFAFAFSARGAIAARVGRGVSRWARTRTGTRCRRRPCRTGRRSRGSRRSWQPFPDPSAGPSEKSPWRSVAGGGRRGPRSRAAARRARTPSGRTSRHSLAAVTAHRVRPLGRPAPSMPPCGRLRRRPPLPHRMSPLPGARRSTVSVCGAVLDALDQVLEDGVPRSAVAEASGHILTQWEWAWARVEPAITAQPSRRRPAGHPPISATPRCGLADRPDASPSARPDARLDPAASP